jgi:hypothetical protein
MSVFRKMFTPLDVCIRVVSAVEYVVKSRFEGVRTWAVVEDAREETSNLRIMIADGEEVPHSAMSILNVSRLRAEGARKL